MRRTAGTITETRIFAQRRVFTRSRNFDVITRVRESIITICFFRRTNSSFAFIFARLVGRRHAFNFARFLRSGLFYHLNDSAIGNGELGLVFGMVTRIRTFVFVAYNFGNSFLNQLNSFVGGWPTARNIGVATFTVSLCTSISLLFVFFLYYYHRHTFRYFRGLLTE